jgi:hypothetical protein
MVQYLATYELFAIYLELPYYAHNELSLYDLNDEYRLDV